VNERRRDPTDGQWRLFSASRRDEGALGAELCPLCPTIDPARPTEVARPSFEIAVFDNRFPRLAAAPETPAALIGDLYTVAPAQGAAEVVVYSDRHEATLAELGAERIEGLVHVWADRYSELGARDEVRYVLIFENGGATVEHPHGEIYGYPVIPPRVRLQLDQARIHLAEHGTCVVCDVVAREQSDGVRIVAQNESFVAFVPFAARFPYEVQVATKRHAASLLDLTDPERAALARVLAKLLEGYDRLFGFPLPYVMALQQAPTDDGGWESVSHLRFEFAPQNRSSGEVRPAPASELAAGAYVNDARPEKSALELRSALSA
jgi:UDPglucose--hexose-1-phosphate uridylyltransferase